MPERQWECEELNVIQVQWLAALSFFPPPPPLSLSLCLSFTREISIARSTVGSLLHAIDYTNYRREQTECWLVFPFVSLTFTHSLSRCLPVTFHGGEVVFRETVDPQKENNQLSHDENKISLSLSHKSESLQVTVKVLSESAVATLGNVQKLLTHSSKMVVASYFFLWRSEWRGYCMLFSDQVLTIVV